MKCPYCGKDLVEGNHFCDGCGAKLDGNPVVNQNSYDYQNGMPPKKSNKGLIITLIIVGVLLIVGIIIGVILLTGGSKEEKSKDKNEKNNNIVDNRGTEKVDYNDSKLRNNIKYTEHKLDNGRMILIVSNKNSVDVDVEFTVEFYDENGTVVDTNYANIYAFDANQDAVAYFPSTRRQYNNYKITYKVEKTLIFTSHKKDVKITTTDNKEDEEIIVTATNNFNKVLDELEISIIYYKNGEIVGYDYDTKFDVDAGKSIAIYMDYPYDYRTYDTVEFDDYKVYVQAYERNDDF